MFLWPWALELVGNDIMAHGQHPEMIIFITQLYYDMTSNVIIPAAAGVALHSYVCSFTRACAPRAACMHT